MKKKIYCQYLTIFITTIILTIFWEFLLEPLLNKTVLQDCEPEDFSEKLEYVMTVSTFCLLALIIPFIMALKMAAKRQKAETEREKLITDLQEAITEIKTLRGIIPICSYCKKIRNEAGVWNSLESYILEHSHKDAAFSHGICPDCLQKEVAGLEQGD